MSRGVSEGHGSVQSVLRLAVRRGRHAGQTEIGRRSVWIAMGFCCRRRRSVELGLVGTVMLEFRVCGPDESAKH
jgi:hypothetical protein